MVYDDFECIFKCLYHPSCISFNLAAKGKLWCELLSSDKYSKPMEYKQNKSSHHYFIRSACITNLCKNNAKCQSGFTDKGYRCICSVGYKGLTCDEGKHIDECATREHSCSADGVCSNVEGSYICGCKPGYSGDGRTCKDIDECALGTHNCSADALCNNTKGSYNCSCKSGYFGDGRTCKATISSCKEAYDSKILSGSGVVTLHIGSKPTSVFCQVGNVECGNGIWTLVMKTDGSKRTFHYDSDYWSNKIEYNPPGGETGFDTVETKLPTYWNTSFSKICLGMKIDQQLRFIVINKEADSLYSLIADGKYRPTSLGRDTWRSLIGPKASSQSHCNREGFNLYPLTAYWEFRAPKARIGFVTNNVENCKDCYCRYLEFKPAKAFDGQRLINHVIQIDDVKDKVLCKIRCFMESNCVSYNLVKQLSGDNETYKCELNDVTHEGNMDDLVGEYDSFYHGSEARSNCIANPCKNNATCQSGFTEKGYRCLCSAGFKGQTCDEDINECATEEQSCSVDAVCNNTKGSYDCECKPGFSGDGWTCKDIDECGTEEHSCSADAVCNNTEGSYNCSCKPGYSGDGWSCKDIDECATQDHSCSADAVCRNTKGSHNCTCKPGYSGDGRTCQDIDECATGTHSCSADAECNNIKGSHNCQCKSGYSGNGRTCTDTDECATKKQNCSADAVCKNTKVSYNCTCKPGYSGNGRDCRGRFSFWLLYINECATEEQSYSADAVCNNSEGSYDCECKPGFSGDGWTRKDIDECGIEEHSCSADAVCNNAEGSYNCSCKPGYSGDG
ncbi:unnamed protein product [Pocillopora meandrina]|uniref:Uncharacterized protein n=1 Tax=Pocillopora meandrina TaxID=46732 RepID=A0AAU9XAM3_9CNID|nr:unnamed protein product [Pocillopora meandrina]